VTLGKDSLFNHHVRSVIKECGGHRVMNSSSWKEEAKLEREGR
jgi:hypothetical protein